jgi:hypothetical protein
MAECVAQKRLSNGIAILAGALRTRGRTIGAAMTVWIVGRTDRRPT